MRKHSDFQVWAALGALAILALSSCSSKDHGGSSVGGDSGGTGGLILTTGGNGAGTGGPYQLPSGFTPGTFGGYKLGEAYTGAATGGTGGAGGTLGAAGAAGSTGGCGTTLTGIVRDFKGHDEGGHLDFQNYCCGDDRDIVTDTIGADQKPVYKGDSISTHGRTAFDQWYRNVDGVNLPFFILIDFQQTNTANKIYTFDSNAFFPLDNQGFGNSAADDSHNFHFTTELHTQFRYHGGEHFTFTGDDDVFVYINGHLAINLGGVHGAENADVDLDASAGDLGITTGNIYNVDFFHAERHTTESNFRIETTMDFVNCGTFVPEIT